MQFGTKMLICYFERVSVIEFSANLSYEKICMNKNVNFQQNMQCSMAKSYLCLCLNKVDEFSCESA